MLDLRSLKSALREKRSSTAHVLRGTATRLEENLNQKKPISHYLKTGPVALKCSCFAASSFSRRCLRSIATMQIPSNKVATPPPPRIIYNGSMSIPSIDSTFPKLLLSWFSSEFESSKLSSLLNQPGGRMMISGVDPTPPIWLGAGGAFLDFNWISTESIKGAYTLNFRNLQEGGYNLNFYIFQKEGGRSYVLNFRNFWKWVLSP